MLSEKIKELRKINNLTQVGLAKELKMSQQAVAKWETGKAEPSSDMLCKLSELFNVSTDFLLGADSQEKFSNDQLSIEETRLLSGYRHLSGNGRKIIFEIISAFATQQSTMAFSNVVQNNNGNGNFFANGGNVYAGV